MECTHCGISCKIKNTDINLSKDLKNKSQQHKLLLLKHLNYLGNILAKHIMGCSIQHQPKEHCSYNAPRWRDHSRSCDQCTSGDSSQALSPEQQVALHKETLLSMRSQVTHRSSQLQPVKYLTAITASLLWKKRWTLPHTQLLIPS